MPPWPGMHPAFNTSSPSAVVFLHRWAGDEERDGQRGVGGDDSSDEDAEEKVSRAEELRRERLGAVVKHNLTGILLEVTDALFGESGLSV